jgi:hypothetical protein
VSRDLGILLQTANAKVRETDEKKANRVQYQTADRVTRPRAGAPSFLFTSADAMQVKTEEKL